MKDVALKLLQATQALFEAVKAGELDKIDHLQQLRIQLITELDLLSQRPTAPESLIPVKRLVEQSRQLEEQVTKVLEQQRDDVNRELSKLRTSKKARKAYGEF